MTASDKTSTTGFGSPVLYALLEQSKALQVITDRQGRILRSSKAFTELAGPHAASGELLPDSFSAEVDGDDQALRERLAASLFEGELAETVVALGPKTTPDSGSETTLWLRLRIGSSGDLRLWTMTDIRAERAMHKRLNRLQELLDTAQEFGRLGVWERNIASGKGRWDEHVFRFWGLDPAMGTPSFEEAAQHIHPDDRNARDFALSTRKPGRYSQRFRVKLGDGSLRWLHSQWEIKAAADGRPTHAIGVMVDDSEPIALARSLGEATAQLTLALELGEIVVFRQDLRSGRIHFNARGFEMLGLPYREDGLATDEVAELIHQDDRQEAEAAAARALADPRPVDMQIRLRRRDGQWRHVLFRRVLQRDALDRPASLLGVALDVTDRLKADQALRQANERIALAARGAGIGAWEHDLRSGQVRWDKQMYTLRGLPMPPATNPGWVAPGQLRTSLAHPDDLAQIIEANRRSLADGSMASYEFRVRWPDGTYRWLASRSIPVHDEAGKPTRQIGLNWDVHDRVVAEEVRREAQAAQRQSDAKSALLARMSHELRTPLNAILGFTDLLEIETLASDGNPAAAPDAGNRGHRLSHIRSAAEKLLQLVDDVLDLSQLETGGPQIQPRPVELQALLDEVIGAVGQKAQQRSVRLRVEADGLAVLADPSRLRQILTRLLGHHLTVVPAGSAIELRASAIAGEVRLSIGDHEAGLSDAQQMELFDAFGLLGAARQAGNEPDFGLFGALLTGMNGRIELPPSGAGGERFRIWLPLAPATSLDDAKTAPSAPAARILYIEDNPVNVILVDELIAQRGNVEFCSEATGSKGVARARDFQPDLILIDIHLPDIDGFEVLRRLRADPATAAICCVALSANVIPEDMNRAREAGFDDYWTKPIRFGSFLAGLNRLLPDRPPG